MSNPRKQIRNIYGYCRVSTTEQAENGISIDTQQELISEFVRDKFNRDVTNLFFRITHKTCLLYTSPSPRDGLLSRMPSSA